MMMKGLSFLQLSAPNFHSIDDYLRTVQETEEFFDCEDGFSMRRSDSMSSISTAASSIFEGVTSNLPAIIKTAIENYRHALIQFRCAYMLQDGDASLLLECDKALRKQSGNIEILIGNLLMHVNTIMEEDDFHKVSCELVNHKKMCEAYYSKRISEENNCDVCKNGSCRVCDRHDKHTRVITILITNLRKLVAVLEGVWGENICSDRVKDIIEKAKRACDQSVRKHTKILQQYPAPDIDLTVERVGANFLDPQQFQMKNLHKDDDEIKFTHMTIITTNGKVEVIDGQ